MLPPRPSTLGLLPIPDRRRRRLKYAFLAGVVLTAAGWLLEIGFVWGVGVGMLVAGVIALLLDRWARGRQAP